MTSRIRVLIVDDTVIYRKILKDVVSELENTEVIGTAPNGDLAIRKIEMDKPDLVLLDVEMPVKDGLETLEEIKQRFPEIGVIMVSGVNERQAAITMEALQKGAIDFVPKPIGNNIEANIQSLKQSIAPIVSLFFTKKNISNVRTIRDNQFTDPSFTSAISTKSRESSSTAAILQRTSKPSLQSEGSIPRTSRTLPKRVDILVVGVSTGGPNALAKFIPYLPADLGVPILIVQHMPPMFTKSLATHLNNKSSIPVIEAEDGLGLEKNKVYIAQGGKHMILRREGTNNVITITDTAPVNSCKPSVDVLFETVPQIYRDNVLSVIMTGMGSDGLNGVKVLKQMGCYSITQAEESCVVYGMPRAVDEAGLSDEQVPLDQLSTRVTQIIKNGNR